MIRTFATTLGALSFVFAACDSGGDDDDTDTHTSDTHTDPPAVALGPTIPPDVDTAAQARLTAAGAFPQVQRLFDELSWQTFVALNWPRDAAGQPTDHLTDPGTLYWETYSESYEVFKADGSPPDPYGEPRTTLPPIGPEDLPNIGDDVLQHPTHRLLFNLSSTDGFDVLDEVNQAFSSPLWDQYGNLVHYEVLLNEAEHQYITNHVLYNLQGQVAFSTAHGAALFPSGQFGTDQVGAIELKLAWRLLTPADVASRYLVRDAFIVVDDPPRWEAVVVGLVGMHIAHKTLSSPQWIWSTFEHVDNLQIDDFAAFGPGAAQHPKIPSFNNPSCEYCPVNVVPEPDASGLRRTQVNRVVPIPKATQAYNAAVQAQLAALGSPLQFYELINTQWPTDPQAPPAPIDQFPQNITNKSGGQPTPTFLISSVMETYFQSGAAGSDITLHVGDASAAIPSTNGGNTPLEFAEGFCLSVNDDCGAAGEQLVLSTESCMGCHSSAGIATAGSGTDPAAYTFGGQLSADFSWLLQQKARPRPE